jgi:superfamily II DNA or RNA helicase
MTTLENREYQDRVVQRTVQHQEDGCNSVMIVSPTGSGKTIMGLLAAKQFEDRFGWRIGWVAMRRELLRQARQENEEKIGVKNIHFISMFEKNPPEVDMLIVDEAQHDTTTSCTHLHNTIEPKYILGMTATPFRTDSVKLCFDKIIKDAGIRKLIDLGYLSPYHHFTMERYDWKTVPDLYVADRERWGKSLMFFLTIDQCERAAARLREAGVRCEVVTGQTDRERQIRDFAEGRVDVTLNVYVLSEGFDCPDLQTVWVRDSSKVCTIQMGGRGLRKHPGKTHVNIVQSKMTRYMFTRIASPAEQFVRVQDSWRTVGDKNDKIDLAAQNTRIAMASSNPTMPSFIRKHMSNPWAAFSQHDEDAIEQQSGD